MTYIKHLIIIRKDGEAIRFDDVNQIYTVGKTITICGKLYEEFPAPGITTKRYEMSDLESMTVEFK